MKVKKTAEKIYDKIDKFAQIWSTILEFPYLSKLTSKEYNKLELEIKHWKKEQDEEFNRRYRSILDEVANAEMDEKKALHLIENLNF